jgi:hypothetical protein
MNKEQLKSLEIVLDFVERYNKMDKEKEVAQAAYDLGDLLKDNNPLEVFGFESVIKQMNFINKALYGVEPYEPKNNTGK